VGLLASVVRGEMITEVKPNECGRFIKHLLKDAVHVGIEAFDTES